MDRRRFLRWLGVGMAVGAAAPSVIAKVLPAVSGKVQTHPWDYPAYLDDDRAIGMAGTDWDIEEHPICQSTTQSIMQYEDYANFSSLALASAIDASVLESAAELSKSLGSEINKLHLYTKQNMPRTYSLRYPS
jgi:hypothetical protein